MDKQIIIDGVDVSGCKHYKNRTCIADYCLTDMPFSEAKCELNPNCYYKQLKRKEQECERTKERLESFQKDYSKLYQVVENKGYIKQLDQLKAENGLFRTAHDNEQVKRRKLEEILTEIKEILSNKNWSCGENNHTNCDLKNECGEYARLIILQKCNEVLDE